MAFLFKNCSLLASGRVPWKLPGRVGGSLALVEVWRSALASLRLNGRSLERPWASLEVLGEVLGNPWGRLVDPEIALEVIFGGKFKKECRLN